MRVQDIMTTGVATTTPETSAEAAWELMRLRAIRHLVVQEGRQLVGLLSATDAGGTRGATLRKGCVVSDLMTPGVVTVPSTTTVRKAANVMRGRSIGSLVVTAKGQPVGIVTVSDLLELIGHGGGRGEDPRKRPELHHRAPHRKRHVSTGAW